MQVLDENHEQMLQQDLMSKKGIVQKWSRDLDMHWEKGSGGWNFFRYSSVQLQFQSLCNKHYFIFQEELAQMQKRFLAPLSIHKYRCAAENATAFRRSFDSLSRHLKQEEVTTTKKRMEGCLRNHCDDLCGMLHVALVQQNMDTIGRLLFAACCKWTQNMRGLCGVTLDAARIAGGVKMVLEALEQHLADFNFKEVRDVVVKLRQLGRIIALCCGFEPSVFEELNNLRVSHCETAEVELSKSCEDARSAEGVTRRLQR